VLLFYTEGDQNGTRLQRAVLTFCPIDEPACCPDTPNIVISRRGPVPSLGLTGPLHNAALAYAPASRVAGGPYFFMAREGHPLPSSHPSFISDHVQVARIASHAIWDPATQTHWEHVQSFGRHDSSKPRNHNAGFVRDVWGMVPYSGGLDVLWSVADADAGVERTEWSYRIWRSKLSLPTPPQVATQSSDEVATAAFVLELIKRGIRLVVFDFDGVMLHEESPGSGLNLMSSPGPHSLSEGFYDLALELYSKNIGMAVVTNNDRINILPVIVSNWRWHQRPERHSDFETIAKSGVFKNVQCWETSCGKTRNGQRITHNGQQMPSLNRNAHGRRPATPVEKNGRIRLAIHRAKIRGALSVEETAADAGVGACCTLLIDDRQDNVRAFLRLGGHAYLHTRPSDGLSNHFFISQLYAPQLCAGDAGLAEERSSAINESELSDWDWWVEQWQLTVEGGAAAEERKP
jgi:hypothetical protein